MTISKGEKFAQLVCAPVTHVQLLKVENVDTIGGDRKGGFGSTSIF